MRSFAPVSAWSSPSRTAARRCARRTFSAVWTREALSPDNLDWLKELPAGPIKCDGAQIAHGSPLDEDHYLLDVVDGCRTLADAGARLNFFGHTHVQGGFADGDGRCYRILPDYLDADGLANCTIELVNDTEYLINPGSVGQPRDGDARSSFALWDSDARTMTFYRVPYDIPAAQQLIRDAGMHEWLADRLALGR